MRQREAMRMLGRADMRVIHYKSEGQRKTEMLTRNTALRIMLALNEQRAAQRYQSFWWVDLKGRVRLILARLGGIAWPV